MRARQRNDDRGDSRWAGALLRRFDSALGEREFSESVQYTEVVPLPNDVSVAGHIPLTELENFIGWRKKRQEHALANSTNWRMRTSCAAELGR